MGMSTIATSQASQSSSPQCAPSAEKETIIISLIQTMRLIEWATTRSGCFTCHGIHERVTRCAAQCLHKWNLVLRTSGKKLFNGKKKDFWVKKGPVIELLRIFSCYFRNNAKRSEKARVYDVTHFATKVRMLIVAGLLYIYYTYDPISQPGDA